MRMGKRSFAIMASVLPSADPDHRLSLADHFPLGSMHGTYPGPLAVGCCLAIILQCDAVLIEGLIKPKSNYQHLCEDLCVTNSNLSIFFHILLISSSASRVSPLKWRGTFGGIMEVKWSFWTQIGGSKSAIYFTYQFFLILPSHEANSPFCQ